MKVFEDVEEAPDLRDPRTQFVFEMMALLPKQHPELPRPGQWKDLDVALTLDGREVDLRQILSRMFLPYNENQPLIPPEQALHDIQRTLQEIRSGHTERLATLAGIDGPPEEALRQSWQAIGEETARAEAPVTPIERQLWDGIQQTWKELGSLMVDVCAGDWGDARTAYDRVAEMFQDIGRTLSDPTLGGEQ